MVEIYLCTSHFIHFHIIYLSIELSENPQGIVFDQKVYFKSKWNHGSIASPYHHLVCQYPSEDTCLVDISWGRIGLLETGTGVLWVTWYIFREIIKELLMDSSFFIDPHNFFWYYVDNSYILKKWKFGWDKNIAWKFVTTKDPNIWLFSNTHWYSIPKEVAGWS